LEDLLTYSNKLISEQSEEVIILEAKKDPKKFKPLYEKYYKIIFRLVLSKVRNKDIAADLTSNVFFKALQSIEKFKLKGSTLLPWLYRIAINESNEHFRKNGGKQFVELNSEVYEAISDEMATYGEEYRGVLKIALTKIKEKDLQIIELRFFESLSFKEIAEVLEITEGHSKVNLYRALDRLRKLMKIS
jgi:RNA polymerase sigma-70 factor, ECF subfamily